MQHTILVVDDSSMIRRIVGQILARFGYRILSAANGEEGCRLARQELPDLVIMDIEMPIMDGIEATARLKNDAATSHIPVLIFTSLGNEEDIRRAGEAGGQGFLNKPICERTLQSAIAELLPAAP